MKLNHFLSIAKVYISWRFSGEFENRIRSSRNILKNIDKIINAMGGGNLYLNWYKNFIKDYNLISKYNLFFPTRYSNISKKSLTRLMRDEKIILKDIILPIPTKDNVDNTTFMYSIMDSLLPYLIDNIEIEDLYSILLPELEGPYEYNMVKLKEGDIVIDAGACLGEFSALAGIKGCKVYAFEPIERVIEKYLEKTASFNKNITIVQKALSNKCEELIFYGDGAGASYLHKSGEKQKVQSTDLDSFVNEYNILKVDFIKADIEGAERYLLMGAKHILKEYAPKLSICTYHLPDDPQVLRNLIHDANPKYVIEERFKKMYAYVP